MSTDKIVFTEELSKPIKDMIELNKKIDYGLIDYNFICFNDKLKRIGKELGEFHEELDITNPAHANFIYNARAYHDEVLHDLNKYLNLTIQLNRIDKRLAISDSSLNLTSYIVSNFLNLYFKSIMINANQRIDDLVTEYNPEGKAEILKISNYFHKYISSKYSGYDIMYLSLILPWNYIKSKPLSKDSSLTNMNTLYFNSSSSIITARKLYENSTIDKFCDINAVGYIFNLPIFIIDIPDLNEKYKIKEKLSYSDIEDDEDIDLNYSPEALNDL